MRAPSRAWFVLAGSSLLACAGATPPPPARSPAPAAAAAAAPKPVAPRPSGILYRDEVLSTVDGGLGQFLQHVEVEPSLDAGRFVGFRIVRLIPEAYWKGVDLKPGDVVTRVNGKSIERDIDAYQAFVSLKSAPDLRVSYLRESASRELVYKIVERSPGS